MLWSGYDDFFGIAISDGEQPGSSALTYYCAGLSVESAVRHPFLDAWLYNHVHPVPDRKTLDYRSNRG
jgi:hypothetical protein